MRKIEQISISTADRERLERLVRDRNTPQKVVWRARIVLLAGEGLTASAIAAGSGKSVLTVRRWRRRFLAKGVAGLLKDATRPPRRKPLTAEQIAEGAIGFATQKDTVSRWLPEGQAVVLLADRFYGTPDMVTWCRDTGWDYRLRLKSNLTARLGSRRQTTGELALFGVNYFENVALTAKRVTTNIGIIRDPGHPEPWIIAMSATPGYLSTLAYADRWGIEPMFSDFKSRGFGIEQTHLHYPDRLGRLILVMALALYWAVSTGMWDQANNPTPAEKKTRPSAQKSRTKKALLVHKRHPKSHQTHAPIPPAPQTLGANPKLMDGKPSDSLRSVEQP
jgi:transposase